MCDADSRVPADKGVTSFPSPTIASFQISILLWQFSLLIEMSSTRDNSLETIPEVEEENEDHDRRIVQVGEGLQAQTNPDKSVRGDNDKRLLICDHPKLQRGATSQVPPELSGCATIWQQAH